MLTLNRPATIVQLMVVVPPYIAGSLALLLGAFRTRNIATVAAVLLAILSVRQFTLAQDWRTHAASPPECIALVSAFVGLALATLHATRGFWARPVVAAPRVI
jgi:hypothetical protein